jgi:hypothetical protein
MESKVTGPPDDPATTELDELPPQLQRSPKLAHNPTASHLNIRFTPSKRISRNYIVGQPFS